jgi:hypothetical protein
MEGAATESRSPWADGSRANTIGGEGADTRADGGTIAVAGTDTGGISRGASDAIALAYASREMS